MTIEEKKELIAFSEEERRTNVYCTQNIQH